MEEKTETYLLTNKGIEKLDASKELSQRDLKSMRGDASDKEKKDDDKNQSKNGYKGPGMNFGTDDKKNYPRNFDNVNFLS